VARASLSPKGAAAALRRVALAISRSPATAEGDRTVVRTAAVIGGASEIAEAILAALAARGLTEVALCGRDATAMARAGERLGRLGVTRAEIIPCDVRETSLLDAVAEQAVARLGQIDLLVVAAGVLVPTGQDELDSATVANLIASNFAGPAAAIAAFVPALRRQGGGRIVVLSSVAATRVRRANFAYGSSKAGLDGFSQGLADWLTGSQVEVLIVRPGFVHTKMTAGRRAQPLAVGPRQVADAVVSGLDRHASVVWVPRVLQPIFALARLVPRRIWRQITR
jgi:decaprenylphospho-beta-D-erythro-pentofuranosid-2-ulose 2-reductase